MVWKSKGESLKKFGFQGGNTMKTKVEKSVKLEDGAYKGKIVELELKEGEFSYYQIVIEEDTTELNLRVGYPASVSKNSAFGRLLERFGAKLNEGDTIETDDYLKISTPVSFLVMNKTTDKGTFANIERESLKPQ